MLNNLSGRKKGLEYVSLLEEENTAKQTRDPASIAEVFNTHFVDLAENLADKCTSTFNPTNVVDFFNKRKTSDTRFTFSPISVRQTQRMIEAIPSSKATGLDGISARLLKTAASAIAPSLSKLINICIAGGTFPSAWKEAKVTPIHKGNSKSDKNNYRPISVLPVLSKILERHLHGLLYNFLTENDLLYRLQSGFRKAHSTETALINLVDRLLLNMDKNCINGLVFADFQKAFDLVNHQVLLEKLQIYGLEENSMALMRSYLCQRKQRTVIGSSQSSSQYLKHGVPQGSVLAPLLFLVFINDLSEGISPPTAVDIFADDTTLSTFSPYTDIEGTCNQLCKSIEELEIWSKNNHIKLNTNKTRAMYVTGKRLRNKLSDDHQPKINSSTGDLLDTTTNHKLLGVYVDQDLSFQKHIDYICKKLSQRIGLLRSIKHYLPFTERVLFYNAIIKPIFMYGGSVWGSTSKDNIRRVFKLQKRAARVILDAKTKETRTVRLFEKLGWLPFYDELHVNKLCIIYKSLNGQCPEYLSDQITRVSDISKRSSRHGNITLRCPKYSRETEGGRTF